MELEKYTVAGKLDITDIICKYLNTEDEHQIIDVETLNYLIYIDFDTNDERIFELDNDTGQSSLVAGFFDIYFNEIKVTHKQTEKEISTFFDIDVINMQNN